MCTRFTTVRVNVTGFSNDVGFSNGVGFEAAGQDIGLMRGAMPNSSTSQVAEIAVQPADPTVRGRTDEPHLSVLTLGVEAL